MPAYSFKANINNQSSSLTLRLVDSNACEGGYTDGWGSPPATIPFGQTIAFQAESTGPLRGCKGYVKYEVGYVRFDGSFQSDGFFCLFWDVPVLGNSSCHLMKAAGKIDCDCDGQMSTDDSSSFQTPPLIFDFGANLADGVPNDGHGHDQVDFYLVDKAAQGFQAEPYAYSPFNLPTAADWDGHWSSAGVDIVIAKVSGDTASIQVHDAGAPSPVSFTTTVDLSKPTGTGILRHPLAALKTAIAPAPAHQPVVSETIRKTSIPLPLQTITVQNMLHLQDDVVLTLMKVSNSAGAAQGSSIRYQIVSLLGHVNRDIEVGRYSPPPR